MKECNKCGERKSDTNFHWKNKKLKIRHSACKDCQNEYYRQRYETHADDYKKNAKKQRKIQRDRNREFVLEYKRSHPCEKCGEDHPACLDFHHTDKNKEFTISALKHQAYSLEKLKKEMQKCQVLCSNCHRKLHFPHLE